MSLPWTREQLDWLQAMGFDVLRLQDAPVIAPTRAIAPELPASDDDAPPAAGVLPPGLVRAARGLELGPLIAVHGVPRDAAARRAFWRVLRPLRKARRAP
ncbi:hypothetical protein [Lysobacter humi (ex Lee et al. 2017)]